MSKILTLGSIIAATVSVTLVVYLSVNEYETSVDASIVGSAELFRCWNTTIGPLDREHAEILNMLTTKKTRVEPSELVKALVSNAYEPDEWEEQCNFSGSTK